MEKLVGWVGYLRTAVEVAGAIVVGAGAMGAFPRYLSRLFGLSHATTGTIRLQLGYALALGLEFQLGADILGTAVAPSWQAVKLLAAIAVIHTALNYFLLRELVHEQKAQAREAARAEVAPTDGLSRPAGGAPPTSP